MRSTDAEGFFTRLLSLMRESRRQAGKRGSSAGTGLTLLRRSENRSSGERPSSRRRLASDSGSRDESFRVVDDVLERDP